MEGGALCFTFLVCCVVSAVGSNANAKDNHNLYSRQSKSYADFLEDISTRVQHAADQQHVELMEDLNDEIYELFSSARKYLTKNRRKSKAEEKQGRSSRSQMNGDHVINMAMMPNDAEVNLDSGTKGGDSDEHHQTTVLHTILHSLQDVQTNQNTTSTCVADLGRLIINLLSPASSSTQSSWALQFFDATGKPGPSLTQLRLNFVGNYDQCRDATAPEDPTAETENKLGFKGAYFRIVLVMSYPANSLSPQMGACLPDTCTAPEVSSLVYELVKGKSLLNIPIVSAYSQKLDAPKEMTSATIAAITILSVIGYLMLVGTTIDVFVIKSWRRPDDEQQRSNLQSQIGGGDSGLDDKEDVPRPNISNGYDQGFGDTTDTITSSGHQRLPTINDDTAPLIYNPNVNNSSYIIRTTRFKFNPENIVVKIFLAFSVYTNGKKLLNTKQTTESLGAVHGIRFFSMSWVVLCHWYGFSMPFTLNSTTEIQILIQRWTFLPIVNGFSSVDSFFTLSGLLTAYITIKEMKRRRTAKINWVMFYFHRFWRLTPPYMLSMLTVLGLSQYIGQGPLWNNVQPADRAFCEKNWWTNLLYVNNLVRTDEPCFGHSWYLANDMQFFVISPLMLVPLYFNKVIGLLSCLVVLLISWITTGVLSTVHKWPTTMISLHPVAGRAGQPEYFQHYYLVPWCRIGPFVVGIVAGYLLALTKGRQFRIRGWVVALGWIVAIASGLAVVYGLRGDITGDNPSSQPVASLYNAVSRSVWGACVCWVIVACSAGYGGPVNAFLSWSPFVVLGRLTYVVYLIHLCLGGTMYQNLGALLYSNDPTMAVTFAGTFVCINLIAVVAVLALESPWLALEKILYKRDSSTTPTSASSNN